MFGLSFCGGWQARDNRAKAEQLAQAAESAALRDATDAENRRRMRLVMRAADGATLAAKDVEERYARLLADTAGAGGRTAGDRVRDGRNDREDVDHVSAVVTARDGGDRAGVSGAVPADGVREPDVPADVASDVPDGAAVTAGVVAPCDCGRARADVAGASKARRELLTAARDCDLLAVRYNRLLEMYQAVAGAD